jgi:ankyrin repeat protein
VRDSRGRTALHVAADSAGETSNAMRRALLSAAPAALLDAPDAAGRSPLTAAAEVGDCALISALLAAGAELGDGLSPVLLAARSGRVQV